MKKETTWTDPLLIIGNVAIGKYYFSRTNIEDEIITEINKGNHILLSAPRRVGKTSIVMHLEQIRLKDKHCVFENIQDIKSETDFYKRIYELVFSCLKKNQKIYREIKNFLTSSGLDSVSVDGVFKFKDKKKLNYKEEIKVLIKKLEKNKTKVILFIDELPDVLHYLHNDISETEQALGILKSIRTWRQNYKQNSLTIVWTGSIGLRQIVSNISGRTSDINDLREITFKPFSNKEALNYIKNATKNATIKYTKPKAQYLLQKINYTIPYFINLMLDEINKIAKDNNRKSINKSHIDQAFDNQVSENENFIDWQTRLFKYFEKSDASFMNTILIFITHKNKINTRELYNLAVKYSKEINYMLLTNNLVRDGYIVKDNDNYLFVSPFLKGFWLKNNPIYDN